MPVEMHSPRDFHFLYIACRETLASGMHAPPLLDSGTSQTYTRRFRASDYKSSAAPIRLPTVALPGLRKCPYILCPGSCGGPARVLRIRRQCWSYSRLRTVFATPGACRCKTSEAEETAAEEGQCGFRRAHRKSSGRSGRASPDAAGADEAGSAVRPRSCRRRAHPHKQSTWLWNFQKNPATPLALAVIQNR